MPILFSRPPLSTPELARRGGFPARGTLPSVVFHTTVLALYWLIPTAPVIQADHQVKLFAQTQIDEAPPLPPLTEAGAEGPSGRTQASSPQEAAPAPGSRKVTIYSGPQHIVSNPPDADNSRQTILQPDLPSPRRLPAPLPLPNIVKMAAPAPLVFSPPPQVKVSVKIPPLPPSAAPVQLQIADSAQPALIPLAPATKPFETPKLPVPVSAPPPPSPAPPSSAPPSPTPPKSAPAARVPAAKQSQPVVTQSAHLDQMIAQPIHGQGTDDRNLLVLNAVNVPSAKSNADVPPGELHGGFEVSPGSQTNQQTNQPEGAFGSSSAEASSAKGSGSGPEAKTTGGNSSGAHAGDKAMSGGNGLTGTDARGGSSSTPGTATGSGSRGTEASNGAGAGNGPGLFPNVTIEGRKPSGSGSGGDPSAAKVPPLKPVRPEGYGMTIISTGSSGGGLRDYGVFKDGPAFTVYLDLSPLGIHGNRWSLQYGVASDVRQAHRNAALAPPYALKRVLPQFPYSLVIANVGRMMVVQAQINVEGKLEAFQVLQSPDSRLNALLQECLKKWSFQAATMDAEPVPVNILLGIPIASVMAQ